MCLFGFVLVAEWFVSEKPYVVWTKERLYMPLVFNYTDQDFGGTLPTAVDYKDPDVQQFVKERGGWFLWRPVPFGPYTADTVCAPPSAPSKAHWLGTDDQGRDVLARLVYGMRTSLVFGVMLACTSFVFGILMGGVQGYFGGIIDIVGQRFTELWASFPTLFVLMVLSSFVVPNLWVLLFLMSFFSWMGLAAFVRAEFLRARNLDYVKAAQILGLPSWRIMLRHVLPNALVGTLTFVPFLLNHGIAVLASLDFLGFGLPPGTASFGEMLKQARNNLFAPWLSLTAFIGLSLILILVTFIGEAARDASDAYKTK